MWRRARPCKFRCCHQETIFTILCRLDHVINVVRDSQTKRAPIERFADILTGYFVPVVTMLALLTWATWLSLGLGGALPPSYLDTGVGGWREC